MNKKYTNVSKKRQFRSTVGQKIFWLAFMLLTVSVMRLQAQDRTISGTVTDDSNGETLPGTSVMIKGTSNGTTTNLDGEFKLSASAEDILVFSFIGYRKQEIKVGNRSVINVPLSIDVEQLGEVVVVGYGTQEEKDVTGAITTVDSKEFNQGQIASPERLIAGKVAGVDVSPGNTRSGGAGITIRGIGSLNGQGPPLFVVDGVPVNSEGSSGNRNPRNFINPNDIESVTVLKDASATAIYGSRAANGVIMYTTKSGKKGETSVSYNGSYVFSEVLREPDFLSAANFRAVVQNNAPQSANDLGEADTDWFNAVTRSAISQNHDISFSGATEKTNYRVSLNHMENKEIIRGDRNRVTRLSMRISSMFLDDHLKITFNTKNALTLDNYKPNVAGTAVSFDPTQSIYDAEADQFGGFFEWSNSSLAPVNPVSTIEQQQSVGENRRSFNVINFDLSIPWVEGLNITTNLSYDLRNGQNKVFEPFTLRNNGRDGFLSRSQSIAYTKNIFSTVSYEKTFGEHSIKALAGYEFQEVFREFDGYSGINLTNDSKGFNDPTVIPQEFISINPSNPVTNQLQSYFGRINYSFQDKYLATFNARLDGSTRFGPDNRYGFFPSAALGWRIIEEDFFSGLTGIFKDLKLRAGWGIVGNQRIGDYRYDKFYFSGTNTASYQFGDEFQQVLRPTAVDPSIKWEELVSTNIGVDFAILDGRMSGELNFYQKDSRDLLFSAPVAAGTNVGDRVVTNIGEMQNRGVELAVSNVVVDRNDFTWNLNYNFSYNQNEVVKLNNETSADTPPIRTGGITGDIGQTIQAIKVGEPIYAFYSYNQKYENGQPVPGTVSSSYEDINGDGIINEDDLVIQGTGIAPILTGITSNMTYKNFDLAFTLRGKFGGQTYNNTASANGYYNRLTESQILNNLHSSVLESGFTRRHLISDYYIEKSDFVKLDNLTIGYNFNQLESFNLRVYGTVQNMLPLTGYSGLDPEVQIDNNIYPPSTAFIMGVNAKF